MSALSDAHVLIIDDEPSIAETVTELLSMSGVNASFALNARNGLAYLEINPEVDIVLLDINLGPGSSGVDILSRIKEQNKYVQVIMFTSMEDLELGIECMKRGAFDYMTKPFKEEVFLEKLPLALEKKHLTRLNDLYLGILVHDLKNPLQSIIGAVEYCKETLDPGFRIQHQLLASAEGGISQIRTIINNILSISRFENGTFNLHREEIILSEEMKRVIAMFDTRADSERKFRLLCHDGEDLAVSNDKALFTQVTTNIISNAIRFTPMDGMIILECGKCPESGGVEIGITNTGSFIPENLREEVFDKFVGTQRTRDVLRGQNFGLGLTFSKMAIESMGGRIWVDGDENVPQTTFHFTIPDSSEMKGTNAECVAGVERT